MPSPRLTNIKGCSEYTGLTVATIYKMVQREQIPVVRLGRMLHFDLRKIDAWIDARSHEAGAN